MIGAVLDHLWQSTWFAGLAGLMTLAFRNNAAGVRFSLWFAASVKFLIPLAPVLAAGGWLFGALSAGGAKPPLTDEAIIVMAPFGAADDRLAKASAWIAGFWALGIATFGTLWIARAKRLSAALRDAAPLAMRAPMPVFSSRVAMEPGLVGVFRSRLIVPDGIEHRLTPQQMAALVAHEACHWRRRDNLTASIHMVVETLFWFHPLVWWIGARMIEERERACDEAVVAEADPQTYAEGLLEVCRHYLRSPLTCVAGVSGADLKKRVEEIMNGKTPAPLTAAKKAFLALAAAGALVLPLGLGVISAPAAAQGGAQGAAVDKPVWLERPNGRSFELHYPKTALDQQLSGRAILDCTVRGDGRVACAVRSEAPEGAGFGAAALGIAADFRMAAKDAEGHDTAGRAVVVPIQFMITPPPAN